MEKVSTRKYFKNQCNHFTLNNNVQILSEKLQDFLGSWDWSRFQKVAVYQPFKDEVLLSRLKARYLHICWLYPQKNYTFSKNSHHPAHSIEEIDLFLVPGVAFDHQCRRLGRGLGFYDRALCRVKKALKVGVSWSVQVSSKPLPEETHDVRMDAVINEKFILYSHHFFEKYRKDA